MGITVMTYNNENPNAWKAVFNTPLESGLRSAALLLEAYPNSFDVQRLGLYDYLIVHTGDVDGGPASIHPATPHRSGELLVRRQLVEAGLEFMVHRGVIERAFTQQGIGYVAGEYAVLFLNSLSSEYACQLRDRAAWVVKRFAGLSDEELTAYIKAHLSQWGAEFMRTALTDESQE